MTKIKSFFSKYYLIFLGFLLITIYFWSRFIRSRISKVLPLDLTVLKFFILLYLCCIFSFIIFMLVISRKKNIIIETFLDWVFIPIKNLEIYIRNLPFIKIRYENFLDNIKSILEYSIIKTNLFYAIFWVFPRLILLTALFIDVFFFNQLHYKYQVILFGLLLFFNRCFKYSLKNIKEEKIKYLSLYIENICTKYYPGIHPAEWPENQNENNDDDDDDDYPPTMSLPLDIFIKFQTESIIYENITRNIGTVFYTQKANEEFWEKYIKQKYVLFVNQPIPEDYTNIFGDKPPENYYKARSVIYDKKKEFSRNEIEKIMQISLLIEHLNKTSNYNDNFKYMKILIYLNYLLCWLYVLLVSLPNLHIEELIIVLTETWEQLEEPFSNIGLYDKYK